MTKECQTDILKMADKGVNCRRKISDLTSTPCKKRKLDFDDLDEIEDIEDDGKDDPLYEPSNASLDITLNESMDR